MPENTVKPGFEIEPIKSSEPLPHDPMDAHWQALIAERDRLQSCLHDYENTYPHMTLSLRAERDELKKEVERMRERVRFADQDCAAECAGLRGEVERLTEACDGYLGHAAGLRAENAKLVERVSELELALEKIIERNQVDSYKADDPIDGPLAKIARAALSRTSEEAK
jgi:hypothetical protein